MNGGRKKRTGNEEQNGKKGRLHGKIYKNYEKSISRKLNRVSRFLHMLNGKERKTGESKGSWLILGHGS